MLLHTYKQKKKAFTLIEVILSTIIIAFIYWIIAHSYKEQYSIIDNFSAKVKSVSLGQQWYNFINYLFLSRFIKEEKNYKDNLINWIVSQDVNTDFFLKSWNEPWLWLFFANWNEIAPNNIDDDSFWVLKNNIVVDGETEWWFVKINWPEDTDHMPNVNNFWIFTYGEDRTWPFYYIEIKKEDKNIVYKWKKIYNLKFIEHFIFKDNTKKHTYSFTINPLSIK